MTSSREFRPVWPSQPASNFTDLALADITVAESKSRSATADGVWLLPDLCPQVTETVASRPGTITPDAAQQAFEKGFSDGLEQGIAQTYEKITPALGALSGLVKSLEQARADFDRDFEQNLYALALAVAQHLIQREVTADPTIVRDLVEQALDLVPHDVALEVRLNPDDLSAIDDQLNRFMAGGRPLHAQWIADSSLDRGSFLLETPLRVVDGRADVALRSLYDRLSHE